MKIVRIQYSDGYWDEIGKATYQCTRDDENVTQILVNHVDKDPFDGWFNVYTKHGLEYSVNPKCVDCVVWGGAVCNS